MLAASREPATRELTAAEKSPATSPKRGNSYLVSFSSSSASSQAGSFGVSAFRRRVSPEFRKPVVV